MRKVKEILLLSPLTARKGVSYEDINQRKEIKNSFKNESKLEAITLEEAIEKKSILLSQY